MKEQQQKKKDHKPAALVGGRLELKKYCRKERKHTPHKETRKK
jgi:ribosomal protein L33